MPAYRACSPHMEIIPTVLEKDIESLENRLEKIRNSSPWIQIDVSDNTLVSGQSFPLELLNRLNPRLDSTLFDIHLMVKEPFNWIKKCLFVQASRIYGQVEMMTDREKFITEIKNAGLEAGLAFDIDTPIDIDIPHETDIILLMNRPMGFAYHPFDISVFPKIDFLKDRGHKVAVDGGVTLDVLPRLIKHGVDIIYSGQSYFDLLNHEKTL